MFLHTDVFKSLDSYEQMLLKEQYAHMNNYESILSYRIAYWKTGEQLI